MNRVIVLLGMWIALMSCEVLAQKKPTEESLVKNTLRDPTRPLNFQVASKQGINLSLQAIFSRGGNGKTKKSAVINGKTLHVGEGISGWKIRRIDKNSVTVQSGKSEKVLYLRKGISVNTRN